MLPLSKSDSIEVKMLFLYNYIISDNFSQILIPNKLVYL